MKLRIQTSTYAAHYTSIFDQVRISATGAEDLYYWFTPLCRADISGEIDVSSGDLRLRRSVKGGVTRLTASARSSLWRKRETVIEFHPDRVECFVRLAGKGRLDRLWFFCGVRDGDVIGSVPGFDRYSPGDVNALAREWFAPNETYSVSAGLSTLHWANSLSAGACFYAFARDGAPRAFSAGLLAKPGENNFDSFDFNFVSPEVKSSLDSVINTQSFSLACNGHVSVNGQWESPRLVIQFGRDRDDCLAKFCRLLEQRGAIAPVARGRGPVWWRRPIFCGWHEQVALGAQAEKREKGSTSIFTFGPHVLAQCTQALHEEWLDVIERRRLPIGTLIIDDRWQKAYSGFDPDPERFPDMRGFIDRCHSRGIRVLLWTPAWSAHGLPPEECILRDGKPIAMDVTHPGCARRFAEGIRKALSPAPGCLNADGFKIDGSLNCPIGPDVRTRGGLYGFELQRRYFEIVQRAAKAAKPDALISVFVANPYLRDLCDMVRLGDLYTSHGSTYDTCRARAAIYRATMKGRLVDVDGGIRFSLAEDMVGEFERQLEFGVPCLYQVREVFQQRAFTRSVFRRFSESDYRRIKTALDRYVAKECK